MKKRKLLHAVISLISSVLLFTGCTIKNGSEEYLDSNIGLDTTEVRFATFNIRCLATENDPQNNWAIRKNRVKQVIYDYRFDVFGAQEVRPSQYLDMEKLLGDDYASYGVGRDSGETFDKATGNEMDVIYYRKDKFELAEKGFFWLSSHPERPGKDWNAWSNRVAGYVNLVEKDTGISFWFMTTHLDHSQTGHDGQESRTKSAILIVDRIKELIEKRNIPCVLVGDMNPGSDREQTLLTFSNYLMDSRLATPKELREGPVGTYNAFNPERDMETAGRGDYIYLKGNYEIKRYVNITDRYDATPENPMGYFPSDHNPVMVTLALTKEN